MLTIAAFAQNENDKTQSPYFVVLTDSAAVAQLPLKATEVSVSIAGMIADITVKQIYKNEGNKTIEAIYTFPGSTRAAVYAMVMNVGKKRIVAKIKEKGEARQIYEDAKSEGKTASLLEQERPNVFTMNVANILPNDSITIEMSYTETLLSTDGVYQFIYPTVVGPRYGGSVGTATTSSISNPTFNANPYTKDSLLPLSTFAIHTTIQAGMPVSEVKSSSHAILTQTIADKTEVELGENETYSGNRDFILNYQLRGNAIQSGLLTYQEDGEKFFFLNLQPPKRVEQKEIVKREYIFIVDVSGSMSGFPLDISKKIMAKTIRNLQVYEKFNIVLFAGGSEVFAEKSVFATDINKLKAIRYLNMTHGGGGTELLSALKNAFSLDTTGGYSRSAVILTDGYVTVEKDAYQIIRNHLNTTNVFAFGIGTSVNRYIIEGIAYSGLGEHFVVTSGTEADSAADKFYAYIQSPLLTDIHIDFGEMKVKDVQPTAIPDMFAARPLYIFGKYEGQLAGELRITGKMGGKDTVISQSILSPKEKRKTAPTYSQTIPLATISPQKTQRAIRYLWAREAIKWKSDYEPLVDSVRKKEITDLGLKYHLLTDYTSFVAVYEKVRNKSGEDTTIRQVLSLPEGVDNQSIGDMVIITGGTPAEFGDFTGGVTQQTRNINAVASITAGQYSTSCVVITAFRNPVYELDASAQCTILDEKQIKNKACRSLSVLHLQSMSIGARRQMLLFEGVPIYWGNDRWGIWDKYSNTIALQSIVMTYAAHKEDLGYEFPNGAVIFNLGKRYGRRNVDISLSRSFYGENHLSLEGAWRLSSKFRAGLIGAGDYNPQQVDNNKDGFLDIAKTKNINLLPYISFQSKNNKLLALVGGNYLRFAQNTGQIANDSLTNLYEIGEKTAHDAYFAKVSYAADSWKGTAFSSLQNHHQSNFAGINTLTTDEQRSFSEIKYSPHIRHFDMTMGANFLYWQRNSLLQKGKDSSTTFLLNETATTLFGTWKWELQDMITETRMAVSFSRNFGVQFTPQLSLFFPIAEAQGFYINAQRFFYPQNALSENIHLLASGRSLRVVETLKPENGKQVIWGYRQHIRYHTLFDIFMGLTDYNNKIVTDFYTHNDSILIGNLHGKARTFSAGFKINQRLYEQIEGDFSYFWERSMTTMKGAYVPEPLVAQHRIHLSATYHLKPDIFKGLKDLNFSANVNGYAHLFYFGRDINETDYKRSSPFALLNCQVENVRKNVLISLAVNNLLNYRPQTPIQNSSNPFSPTFDASQIYAPMLGRSATLSVGWKWQAKDK